MDTADQLLEKVELTREKGEHAEALSLAEQAIILAIELNQPEKLINALAHKLLIFKDKYTYTHNPVFLELMLGDAQTGLRIVEKEKLTGQPKAVMLLRTGNYYFEIGDFNRAVKYFTDAINEVDKMKSGEYADYLSYLGRAQAKSGNIDKGTAILKEALALAEQSTDLRPFHKLIATCGILLRLADVLIDVGNKEGAQEYFDKGYSQAQELRDAYGMPVRFEQARQFGVRYSLITKPI